MNLIVETLDSMRTMPLVWASFWAAVINVVQFGMALAFGHWLVKVYGDKRVSEPPEPLSRTEIVLAVSCVVINSLVFVAGLVMWRTGVIRVHYEFGVGVLLDVLVFFVVMDFAMYVLHRVAHHPLLYPLIHLTHHRYENPRPLTLFVLNPAEVLGFGVLWLIVVSIYPSSVWGIILFLTLNLVFGLVGHVGVEPLPARWLKLPLLRYVTTSTFHAGHHGDKDHNYGFYTLIWDRLFGTLSPEYEGDFVSANQGAGQT
jgi:sterol desaturase/sphingolipid hydroxylase (fatty acid hydroxylase superfamily)